MNIVDGITAQPAQVTQLTLADGSVATIRLVFRPQQNGWFYDASWPGSNAFPVPFQCDGRRLVTSANLLRQFMDVIPFGLACFTVGGGDPMTLACFADGSATLVLLNATDIATAEAEVFTP